MKPLYALLFTLLFSGIQAMAADVYIANSGTDAAGYGGISMPYHTWQYAYNNSPAGTTFRFVAGTYSVASTMNIDKSCRVTTAGGTVILDAGGMPGGNVFYVNNTSQVSIDSITIQNCIGVNACGILVANGGGNINISSCALQHIGWTTDITTVPVVSDNAHAIWVLGNGTTPITNIRIAANTVTYCTPGYSEAITVSGYVNTFAIDSNILDSIANIGIDCAGTEFGNSDPALNQAKNGAIEGNMIGHCNSPVALAAGIYIDGAINCTVAGNRVLNCAVGIAIGAEHTPGAGAGDVSGNIVRDNLIYQNAAVGMIIGGTGGIVHNTRVYNNTLSGNRTGDVINGITSIGGQLPADYSSPYGGEIHLQNSDGTVLENNIISARGTTLNLLAADGYTITNFSSDYNLFFRQGAGSAININNGCSFNGQTVGNVFTLAAYQSAYSLDAHSNVADPLFTNAGTGDLSLMPASPAREMGDPVYSATYSGNTDYNGDNRMVNGRTDAGAIEYQGPPTENVNNINANAALQLYPNPTTGIVRIQTTQPVAAIQIANVLGRLVLQPKPLNGCIDISELPAGAYFITVQTAAGNYVGKVVKL